MQCHVCVSHTSLYSHNKKHTKREQCASSQGETQCPSFAIIRAEPATSTRLLVLAQRADRLADLVSSLPLADHDLEPLKVTQLLSPLNDIALLCPRRCSPLCVEVALFDILLHHGRASCARQILDDKRRENDVFVRVRLSWYTRRWPVDECLQVPVSQQSHSGV